MTTWHRIDGSVLRDEGEVDAEGLSEYFRYHGILAVVDRYPGTPELMGIRVLGSPDGRVALLAGDSFASGLEIQELAEDMASRFTVDVLLGDVTVEEDEEFYLEGSAASPEGGEDLEAASEEDREFLPLAAHACDCGEDCGENCECEECAFTPLRAITVTTGGDDEMPGLARALGHPITVVRDGVHQIVLTEPGDEVPGVRGWDPDLLPMVQILAHLDDRTVVVQTDLESATVTWGAVRHVAAPAELSPEQSEALALITSDEDDAQLIASATAGADLNAVRASLAYSAATGPRALLEALGLDPAYADFLEGNLAAEELPGARLVEPASPADLFRQSFEQAVEEVSESRPVEFVAEIEQEWPTLIRSLSMGKGMAGAALFVAGLRTKRGWGPAGAIAGAALVVYSFADVAMYEWLRRRREKA